MEDKDLEVLAMHADQLNNGTVQEIQQLDVPEGDKEGLLSLMHLATRVKQTLTPVSPSPAYRQRLRTELLHMAGRGADRDVIVAAPAPPREVVVGAAVALLGGVAYVIRNYMQHRPRRPNQARS